MLAERQRVMVSDHGPVLTLIPVDEGLRAQVEELKVAGGQENLVASNRESLNEAASDPHAQPRAVFADGRLVGFLMYDATSDKDCTQIYRFMIDARFQGQGYGRRALGVVLAEIAAHRPGGRVSICYEPQNIAARRLYTSAGFVEDALDEDGEMVAFLESGPAE